VQPLQLQVVNSREILKQLKYNPLTTVIHVNWVKNLHYVSKKDPRRFYQSVIKRGREMSSFDCLSSNEQFPKITKIQQRLIELHLPLKLHKTKKWH